MSDQRLDALRDLIQEDVGGRGLRTDPVDNLLTACPNDFHDACRSLAETPNPILGVVTGFFIPHGQPPAAETDGPLGAIFLARALLPLGIRLVLASDAACVPALAAGLASAGLRKVVPVVTLPSAEEAGRLSGGDYWQHFAERAGPLTHLLALERVGPSHTLESVTSHAEEFLTAVPPEDRDRCHTMRGRDITTLMSPAYRLFEVACHLEPRVTSIGIGDGGNEIGMGKVTWDVIRRNIPNGACVACRVPTDYLVVAGVSNWGAYGLAAGVCQLRGVKPDSELFNVERERELLRVMVEHGPLVDGVTGEQTVSVDGLDFDRYAEPLRRLAMM